MIPAAIILRVAFGLFALSTALVVLFLCAAPERDDLDDGPAPIPAAEPWRRPIDTGLSRTLRIAREGRH